jgi:EmrB/QacA subfamily drug resistance transporter
VLTRPRHPTIVLLALTMAVFMVTVNVTVVVVALPDLQSDLHARSDEIAWVIDAYNLVGASLLLAAGWAADTYGRRRILISGYAIFTGGALLCGLAPSIGWLIGFRVLQAVGGTALTPTSLGIVANLYPEPRERARAIGIWGVASGLGTGLGPVLGGAMTEWMGWRSVFAANAVLGGAALLVAVWVVPRSRSETARRIDVPGQILAAGVLSSLTFALIEAPRLGWTSPAIVGLLAASAVGAVAFAIVELRAQEPLIDLRFFHDHQFSGAVFITVAAFFAFAGFIFLNSLYLQRVRGYSPLEAGLLTLPAALPTLAGGPFAGWLVSVRGPRGVLAIGTFLMAAGLGLMATMGSGAGLPQLVGAYLVLGIGYAVINAPISTVAVSSMPRAQAAVAAAVASSGRNVGLVMGIAVLGSIVDARLPGLLQHADYPVAFTQAVQIAYAAAAVVAVAATVVALLTLRAEPPAYEEAVAER